MPKFCAACGSRLDDAARFCATCGGAVAMQTAIQPAETSPGAVSPPKLPIPQATRTQSQSSLKTWGLWALLIVAGIAIKLGISTTTANNKLNQQESHYVPNAGASASGTAESRLRIYEPGDTWTYDLTATYRSSNGQTVTGNGTDKDSVASVNINGQNVLAENEEISVDFGNGHTFQQSNATYFIQDTAGNYQEVGDNSGPNHAIRLLDQPTTIWPGEWSDNAGLNTSLVYRGGSQGRVELSVMAAGQMEAAATGQQVMCWTAQSDETETDGTKVSIQMLYAPQLGQPIQEECFLPQANGSTLEFKGTLVSDNLQ